MTKRRDMPPPPEYGENVVEVEGEQGKIVIADGERVNRPVHRSAPRTQAMVVPPDAPGGQATVVDTKSLSKLNTAEAIAVAEAEGLTLPEGLTLAQIVEAIRANRGAS